MTERESKFEVTIGFAHNLSQGQIVDLLAAYQKANFDLGLKQSYMSTDPMQSTDVMLELAERIQKFWDERREVQNRLEELL